MCHSVFFIPLVNCRANKPSTAQCLNIEKPLHDTFFFVQAVIIIPFCSSQRGSISAPLIFSMPDGLSIIIWLNIASVTTWFQFNSKCLFYYGFGCDSEWVSVFVFVWFLAIFNRFSQKISYVPHSPLHSLSSLLYISLSLYRRFFFIRFHNSNTATAISVLFEFRT